MEYKWKIRLTTDDGITKEVECVNEIGTLVGMINHITNGTNFMTFGGKDSESCTIYVTSHIRSIGIEKLEDLA